MIVTENQSHGDIPGDRSTKQEETETESPGQASGCSETYSPPKQTLFSPTARSFREQVRVLQSPHYDVRDQQVRASRSFASRPPPILPLSRTRVWLASRSSFSRCSREECSSASFACKDLYRFTL